MTTSREDFLDTDYLAPQGPLEQSVSAILAEVLGIDRFGREDSFYDFGGTSLQAIRACARIERETALRAQPIWLFDHDVLADFVRQLQADPELVDG